MITLCWGVFWTVTEKVIHPSIHHSVAEHLLGARYLVLGVEQ